MDEFQDFNVASFPEQDDGVDVFPAPTAPRISEEVAKHKAERYDYALGDNSPGVSSIQDDLLNGFDDMVRNKAMSVERSTFNQYQQQVLTKFMNEGTSGLGDQAYTMLQTMSPARLAAMTANPDTFIEKKHAQRIADDTGVDLTNPARTGLETYLTKQYGLNNLVQDVQTRLDNESFFTKAVGFGVSLTPYSWWTNHDAITKAPTSSYLKGNNLKEQADYILSIEDPDVAIMEARRAIDEMYKTSPYDALSFANAIASYSSSDQGVDNFFNALGVATSIPAIALAKGVGRAAGVAKASIPGVLDASGQTARAAWMNTMSKVRNAANTTSGARVNSFDTIANEIPKVANPSSVLSDVNTTPFSREYANRLESLLTTRSEALLNKQIDINNVTRIDPNSQAWQAAAQETQDLFNLEYPGLNNHVLSIEPVRSADNVLANTDFFNFHLGRNDGTLFGADYEARAVANLYGLKNSVVKQRGNGWYIEVSKAVDETTPTVRNALQVDTAITQTPDSIANRFMGWFRTKDELLPDDIRRETKGATTGSQQFSMLSQAILEDAFKKLPKWRNSSRRDFIQFLENQRDFVNPTTGQRGRFDRTIGEFYRSWNNVHGRPPTEAETTAYFTYTQVSDAEWMARNLNIYKGKSRLGFENFHFKKKGIKFKVPPRIEGRVKRVEDIFRYDDDAGILVWDDTQGGAPRYMRKNFRGANNRATLEALEQQGYRVVQLSDFGEQALRQFPTVTMPRGRINYVLVKDYETAPLDLRQIPYRPGGHVVYADKFFLSQPNIVAHGARGSVINDYYGDRNLFAFRTREQAVQFQDRFNHARELLRNRNYPALRAYLARNANLPYDFQTFTRMFDPRRGGIFDVNTPFYARSSGASVHSEHKLDRFYENFRDPLNTPHNAFNEDINMSFAMERDEQLHAIENLGSRTTPFYNTTQARMIDPGVSLTRSIAQAAKTRYLDDLKIKSAERFFQEFGDVLSGSSEELQRFPMRTLFGDTINKTHPHKERVAAAQNYQRAMKEFFNIKTEDQQWVDTIVNSVAEQAINSLGERAGSAVMDHVEPWMVHTISDPTRFLRRVAFIPTMGLFNIKQLFMQGLGVVHTMAIEGPSRALNGAMLGNLMRPLHLRGNDVILDHAANLATKWGITPAHFKESYLALQRSGFQNVGGEYGTLDDVLHPTIVRSGFTRVMDNSLIFFKKGERVNRLTAWNASYLRWREANPIAAFDNQAQKEVLDRADLLTMNMTRASNASWNNGWKSIPTQFLSYQSRLMDQMLGGRLTLAEKARVWTTYSALYGVPLGTAGTTIGALWPWHEEARKQAMEYGVDITTPGMQAFMNGIPQAMMSYLSEGEVDPNIAATFGPNGSSILKDFIGSENKTKSALEIVGGPSYRTIMSMFKAGSLISEPVLSSLLATTDDSPNIMPLTQEDFIPLLETATGLNNARKAFLAYTTGKYFTKNGLDVIVGDKSSGFNAAFTALLGTQPQEVADTYNKVNMLGDIRAAQKSERDQAIKFLRLAHQRDVSDDDRLMYYRRAKAHMIAGDFTAQQRYNIIKEAANSGGTVLMEIDNKLKNQSMEEFSKYYNKIMKEPVE